MIKEMPAGVGVASDLDAFSWFWTNECLPASGKIEK